MGRSRFCERVKLGCIRDNMRNDRENKIDRWIGTKHVKIENKLRNASEI